MWEIGLGIFGVIICIISSISSTQGYNPFDKDKIKRNKWYIQCKKTPNSSECVGMIPPAWQLGGILYYLCLYSIGTFLIFYSAGLYYDK